jgi:hypothetical protein
MPWHSTHAVLSGLNPLSVIKVHFEIMAPGRPPVLARPWVFFGECFFKSRRVRVLQV